MARIIVLLGTLFYLSGCAAVGLTVVGAAAGIGAGAGVEHALNGITYKTFTAPMNTMRLATLKALDRMGMGVAKDAETAEGWHLVATAIDRTIDIELQRVTDQTTRMRVVANEGQIFFKDAATATEIVLQTAQTLDEELSRAKTARRRS